MKKQRDDCRAWLESYRELKAEEARLWRRHQRLRALATRITTQLKDVPGGGGGDRERLLAALADEDAEAMAMHAKAEARRREIEEFIDQLPTPISRIILRLRYIEAMRWVELKRALEKSKVYYEERQIYRLHGAALREARAEWKRRSAYNE